MLVLRRGERAACGNCGVEHDAMLTDGACPVCGTDSGVPGAAPGGLDRDQRLIAVVGVTMIANLLILGWLAILYLQI